MIKHFSIFFLCFLALQMSAQESALKWETDVPKAVDLAIKEKKPLFLFFTGSDWCGWCKRLQNEVFSKPEFAAWAKQKVVLVELDFPRMKQVDPDIQKQNYEIAQMFGVQGYPTVWFVTASRNDAQILFGKLGSTGYVAGGPNAWIEGANKILQNQ